VVHLERTTPSARLIGMTYESTTMTTQKKARAASLLVALTISPCSFADMKGKVEMHYSWAVAPPGIEKESTIVSVFYVQGSARRKDEWGEIGSRSATIRDCESGKGYVLDLDRRQYWELRPLRTSDYDRNRPGLLHGAAPSLSAKTPTVIVRSQTVESGKPRVLLGRVAHHFVTTAKEFLNDSDQAPHAEETIDGWYWSRIRPFSTSCLPADLGDLPFAWIGVLDFIPGAVPVFRHTGPSPVGFPVEEKRIVRTKTGHGDGDWETLTQVDRVVEFSDTPLDPSLFQIPSGFAKVPRPHFDKPR